MRLLTKQILDGHRNRKRATGSDEFTGDGSFLTTWGSLGNANGQFNAPIGVAVNADGNVFVADESPSRPEVGVSAK